MIAMPYTKLLSPVSILDTAIQMVECGNADGISLRAVASALGVKAPSLYRYFPQKEALDLAVAHEALRAMFVELQRAAAIPDSEGRFRETANAYLRFARERFALYSFLMSRVPETHGSGLAKAVWNLLLDAASGVSGQPDDTGAAVATWSFLHGYAVLEHSGGFGASGPRHGLERGMTAFLTHFRQNAEPVRTELATGAAKGRRRKRP